MQLSDIIENIPSLAADSICVAHRSSLEAPPVIQWANPAFCEMFKMSREDAVGSPSFDLFHSDYIDDFVSAVTEMYDGAANSVSHDSLFVRSDQSSFWGSVSFTAIRDETQKGRFGILMISDIDDLKNREQSAELALLQNGQLLREVEAAQTRLFSAIDMIPDPFAIYDTQERLVIWNSAFVQNATGDAKVIKKGMKKEDILKVSLENGFITDAVGHEDRWLKRHMSEFRGELAPTPMIRIRGRDYKSILSSAPNGDRVVLRIDISEQLRQRTELEKYAKMLEQANNEISHQALHDELTGLGNRRFLNMKLEEMIAMRELNGGEIVALHIDLDKFKQINDTLGHAAGDHVLVVVADILRKGLRKQDVIARTGGDEFIVLLNAGAESTEPEMLAQRLIAEISKPIPFEDRLCRLGASIGIARTPIIEAEDLLTSSDVALYKAKQGGRSMLAIFDHMDLENIRASKRLSDDIIRGIEESEFIPFYQPQVDAKKREFVGFEVLARWQHPTRGILPPGEFLDAANEMQVTRQIDEMIFRKSLHECRDGFAGMQSMPFVAFNVSIQRLMDSRLDVDLDEIKYPGPISFELVETDFVDHDSHEFLARIDTLRGYGATFEIDDFGSGRASLVGLRQIDADRIKIDHRLVQPIIESESARRLVRSIVGIGHALDIAVTGEGVETEEHGRLLTELGCDRLQGFYFARPMPFATALKLREEQATRRTGTND